METKEFWRTSEFWISILTNLGALASAIAGALPMKYAVPLMGLVNGLYAISRGLAKAGVPPPT